MVKRSAHVDALLGWMDSLAEPMRLRLMHLLESHELGVADLCDILQSPQSTVSRHLKVLGDQGWLTSRRQGTNHLYRLTPAGELAPASRKLWQLAREQTAAWPAVRQDELRLERLRRDHDADGDSRAFFSSAASQWDRIRGELYGSTFTVRALLALLPRDMVVADLGCGTAPLAAELAPHVRSVIGIDNSSAMLRAARKRTARLPNVELRQGDLGRLPVTDEACDAAMMVLALTYAADPAGALGEMARILRPGGRAVLVDLLPHDRADFRRQMGQRLMGFDPAELERLLIQSGLKNVKICPLPPETQAKGPALFLATATK